MRYTGIVAALAVLVSGVVSADEGMWWPGHIAAHELMLKRAGLRLPVEQLQQFNGFPLNAVASINNCSAVVISKQGLVLTSYHCIKPYLPAELNELQTAFAAAQPQLEIPLAGATQLAITEQVTDITTALNRQLSGITDTAQRFTALDLLKQQYVKQCEAVAGYRCKVHSFYNGLEHYLVRSFTLNDLRVAYLPSQAMRQSDLSPNTGTWPQYSADFIVLRAYVGTDGLPASYAAENTPYRPAAAFPISGNGIMEGDAVVVAGYPDISQRLNTAAEVKQQFTEFYPLRLRAHQRFISVIQQLTASSYALPQFQSALQQLNTEAQQYQRAIDSYQQSSVSEHMQRSEQALTDWINSSPVRQQLYAPVMVQFEQILAQQLMLLQRDTTLRYLEFARLPALAKKMYAYALYKDDPESVAPVSKQSLFASLQQLNENFNLQAELEMAFNFQRFYSQLSSEARLPELDRCLGFADNFNREIVRHKLETLYRNSELTESTQRSAWLERSAAEFEQSQDAIIALAVTLHRIDEELARQRQQWNIAYTAAKQAVTEVLLAFNQASGRDVYPDANGTLRIAIGKVNGYQPEDAVWFQPFSTARGLVAKHRTAQPSPIPDKLLQALKRNNFGELTHRALRSLPVNFLSNADTNNGNAGSATLNSRAELVGMVIGKLGGHDNLTHWIYDATQDRTVHLDSRFLLWQLQQTEGSERLLAELDIVHH